MVAINFSVVLLWFLLATLRILPKTTGIELNAKFYTKRLQTYAHCEEFSRLPKTMVARCDAYYDSEEGLFYLDHSFRYSLQKCAEAHRKRMEKQLQTIIYTIKGVVDYGKTEILRDMVKLEAAVDAYIEIVPQVTYLSGPGAKKKPAKNLNSLSTSWVCIAPSETENRMSYYPQVFFNQLNLVEYSSQVANKYLVLNGWHLRNIPTMPQLDRNIMNVFAGIIIWVERSNAHQIGKNEVVKFLNGTSTFPVWFEMQGSPDFSFAGRLEAPVGLIIVILVLVLQIICN